MQTNNNKIFLRGRLAAPPALSHINHGTEYFLLPLTVCRLSGAADTLHVVAARDQLAALPPLGEDSPLTVRGEVRTAGWWSASSPGSSPKKMVRTRITWRYPGPYANRPSSAPPPWAAPSAT